MNSSETWEPCWLVRALMVASCRSWGDIDMTAVCAATADASSSAGDEAEAAVLAHGGSPVPTGTTGPRVSHLDDDAANPGRNLDG